MLIVDISEWKNVCPEMKQCSGKHPAVICSPLFSAEILKLNLSLRFLSLILTLSFWSSCT